MTLDYETKSSYTGQVKWTVQGQQAVAKVTINVTNIEPGKPGDADPHPHGVQACQ